MVGLAFTALQVGTAEAVKDCAGFTPGTPSFQSCVDANAKAALNNNEGNQSGGDAGAGAMQNNSGTATPTGAPGAAATGDPAVKPSLVDRFKGMLGLGTTDGAPPTEAPGTAPMGDPNMAPPMGNDSELPCGDMSGVPCDGPPMDPRSGQPFTQADEAKFQKYADECEATKGLLSEGSTQELVKEGFTQIQVEDLCKNGPQTAPPAQ